MELDKCTSKKDVEIYFDQHHSIMSIKEKTLHLFNYMGVIDVSSCGDISEEEDYNLAIETLLNRSYMPTHKDSYVS